MGEVHMPAFTADSDCLRIRMVIDKKNKDREEETFVRNWFVGLCNGEAEKNVPLRLPKFSKGQPRMILLWWQNVKASQLLCFGRLQCLRWLQTCQHSDLLSLSNAV